RGGMGLLPHDAARLVYLDSVVPALLLGDGDLVRFLVLDRGAWRRRLEYRRGCPALAVCRTTCGCRRGGLRNRLGASPPVTHPPAVVHPAHAVLQLVHRCVQCRVKVTCRGLGADRRTLAHAGDLDALAVLELTTVRLVEQLDVESDDLPVVAREAGQLVADVDPIVVGYLDVAALHDDVHSRP